MSATDTLEFRALELLEGFYGGSGDNENVSKVRAIVQGIRNSEGSADGDDKTEMAKLEDAALNVLEHYFQDMGDRKNLQLVREQQLGMQQARALEAITALPMVFLAGVLEFQILGKINHSFQTEPSGQFAFAFDVDGVLTKDWKPLSGALDALRLLQKGSIPFIFLTNSGGRTEAKKAEELGEQLGLELSEKQIVLSHTPFRDLVPELKDQTVLVIGGRGNSIRELAHAYSFNKVVTPSDIYKATPDINPFGKYTKSHHLTHGEYGAYISGQTQVSTILVWTNSRDWSLDMQIILDLLLSRQGRLGTTSPLNGNSNLPNRGYLQDGQPKIYYCNPDLTFPTSYPTARAAQGTFAAAVEGIWYSYTNGADLTTHVQVCGKPTRETYLCGEKVLKEYHKALNAEQSSEPAPRLKTVYMVGDNPASDIAGANAFNSPSGAEWKSILVESGVFERGAKPRFEPTVTVPGVKDAVEWALEREGYVVSEGESAEWIEMQEIDAVSVA
jgi:HAD superfamily hydrolase (TIGR01456 family)